MNPSRDIEKLFDQFGGDASNYQEIGRENEASHARTRWPLLATLDLSQPSIPNVAPNRDLSLAPVHDDRPAEARKRPWGAPVQNQAADMESAAPSPAATSPAKPAFTRDTLPRLFSRPNRKTIPPVANIALPGSPVGAERFSALVDAVEGVSNVEENAAGTAPEGVAPAQPRVSPSPSPSLQQQSHRPTLPRSQPLATPEKLPGFASAFQLQRPQPASKPSLPRVQTAQNASDSAAPSILGKMFRPPVSNHTETAQPASAAQPNSLQSMFQRLRDPLTQPAPAAPDSFDKTPVAGNWLAKRASRS